MNQTETYRPTDLDHRSGRSSRASRVSGSQSRLTDSEESSTHHQNRRKKSPKRHPQNNGGGLQAMTGGLGGRLAMAIDPFIPSSNSNTTSPKLKRKKSGSSLHRTSHSLNAGDVSDHDIAIDQGELVKHTHFGANGGVSIRPFLSTFSSATTTTKAISSSRSKHKDKDRENKVKTHSRHSSKSETKPIELADAPAAPVQQPTYSGPIAAADFERMKKELEAMKKQLLDNKKTLHDNKKTIKAQRKMIDELKAELSTSDMTQKDQEAQLEILEAKTKADAELITTIESAVQCQICLELLSKPYGLSPCGHVLCVACLQEWFRKAPSDPNEMDMDIDMDDPEYIMYRRKSCPCCRTQIRKRPIPIFVVKSVASALIRAKKANGTSNGSGSPIWRRSTDEDGNVPVGDETDPWKGLFPEDMDSEDIHSESESDEEWESYSESDAALTLQHPARLRDIVSLGLFSSDEDDIIMGAGGALEIEGDEDSVEGVSIFGSLDGGDDENDAGDEDEEDEDDEDEVYIAPRWQPPSRLFSFASAMNARPNPSALPLLRRGCPPEMIEAFGMQYRHDEGLIAYVTSLDPDNFHDPNVPIAERFANPGRRRQMCRLYLGWNIRTQNWDATGEAYMHRLLTQVQRYPRRWRVTRRNRRGEATYDATHLVREGQMDEYETTDTEAWLTDE